jgi:dihydrofolate reductase
VGNGVVHEIAVTQDDSDVQGFFDARIARSDPWRTPKKLSAEPRVERQLVGGTTMRRIIEYTLISADGGMDPTPGPSGLPSFLSFRDDAYMRDGLGVLSACDAMLMGRTMYEASSKLWPTRENDHPWAARLNAMPKYVFSSRLERADWNNTTIVRGDVAVEARKLKEERGGDLLIWGHTRLAESLMKSRLIDVLDLSFHPVLHGSGKRLSREGQDVRLKLVAAKAFSNIVKLTYEPQYERP